MRVAGCKLRAAKADLYPDSEIQADFRISSVTGRGIEEWLDEVLSGRRVAGSRILTVDYDRYAAEEAALGWLNLHADLRLCEPVSPSLIVGPLLDRLDRDLPAIAHLKVFDRAASGYIKAGLTAKGQEPAVEGDLLADAESDHELVINLRAPVDPGDLERVVGAALDSIGGEIAVRHSNAFRPAYPRPQFRFGSTWSDSARK